MAKQKNIYVIDTCVLLHDPECIYKFEEHDIYIPLACIDDLDEIKTRRDNSAWAAREVFRNLDKYDIQQVTKGIVVNDKGGKMFIYNHESLPARGEKPSIMRVNSDNAIIDTAHLLISSFPKRKVVIVTKDTGLRVRANTWGCVAENYKNDLLDDDIYKGYRIVEVSDLSDWEYLNKRNNLNKNILKCKDQLEDINPNEFITFKFGEQSVFAWNKYNGLEFLEEKKKKDSFMGISAKNMEQRFALEALNDDNIPLVCLSGPAGSGKAQPLDSMILTKDGWVTFEDIKIGDKVAGSDGEFHNVTGVFPQGKKEVVKLIFSDGAEAECCKEHLWATKTELQRDKRNLNQNYTVKNTLEIIESLVGHDGRKNHSIPIIQPVNFETKTLPLDPYLLGAILGDGGISKGVVSFTSADEEILSSIEKVLPENHCISKQKKEYCYLLKSKKAKNNFILNALRDFGLQGHKSNKKFIPDVYKIGSIDQRISLLQGLLDTDGYISKNNSVYFYTVSDQLAEDVKELVNSLGGICKHTSKIPTFTHKGEKKIGQKCNVLCISLPNNIEPFRLTRKLEKVKARSKYIPARYISDVIELGEKECQCISVDAKDSLYVTNNYVLTHNTMLSVAVALEKINQGSYDRLIVMKPLVPVGGKDVGFLPGSKNEKISAWLGPIKDNLLSLTNSNGYSDNNHGKSGGLCFDDMIEDGIIEAEAMTFIQGRSIPNSFILLDECENVSPKEARMVVERCGKGSKVVLLGDLSQIENPYLDKHSCGLAHAINGGKTHEVAASVNMTKVERSVLAAAASKIFKPR